MCGCERAGAGALMLLCLLAPGASPAPLRAQVDETLLPAPGMTLVAGVISPDLADGAGAPDDGTMIGVRLDLPLASWIVLEPSAERLDLGGGGDTRWQVDFGVRAEASVGRVRPYAGGSAGALLWPGDARPTDADFVVATYGILAGVRVPLGSRFGVRGEGRFRWLDGLERSTTTVDAGVSWRF